MVVVVVVVVVVVAVVVEVEVEVEVEVVVEAVYAFGSTEEYSIPKSGKCTHSATRQTERRPRHKSLKWWSPIRDRSHPLVTVIGMRAISQYKPRKQRKL